MKIAFIATYPPRECGIGTFTRNKFLATMNCRPNGEQHEGIVIAVNDEANQYDYPEEVQFVISQNQYSDYAEAAQFINESGADVCILEHEFGIFGGQSGVYVLSLLHDLKIPVIAVFHTVLKRPSQDERNILTGIAAMAAQTVVMSNKAVEFLVDIYNINSEKIQLIEHGVPDLKFDPKMSKRELRFENKTVLLTFGLIGRNKGIETVIKALPPVISKYPDVIYIVLGKTHPAVLRHSGEEYRNYLKDLVTELELTDHVLFLNEFVNEKKLCKYLSAADIYVTPYLNEAQITSGTLSYAVGSGCAVISTPYWHAAELLSKGLGRLFEFNDSGRLSSLFMELLDHPAIMNGLRKKALRYGREVTWSRIGQKYIDLSATIIDGEQQPQIPPTGFGETGTLSPFSLDHAFQMTDDTGIIQHAKFGIPNLKEGYCIDDNARALLMILMAGWEKKNTVAEKLLPVYLRFIHYMQNEDGTFRNFLSYNRNFLDERGSEDSFGRTIWALGYLLSHSSRNAYYSTAKEIFDKARPNFLQLQTPRGIANTIIGISYYLHAIPSEVALKKILNELAYKLIWLFEKNKTESWQWFESVLTYDNGILPLSLLHAGEILHDIRIMKTAMQTIRFLSVVTLKKGHLSVVGNENWYAKDGKLSIFAQQPIDAMAMVLLFQKSFELTKDETYMANMYTCFKWFLGENDLRISLYDPETKGCYDGLEKYGVNKNQGAESTLAYLISHLAIQRASYEMNTMDGGEIRLRTHDIHAVSGRERATAL